MITMSRNFFLLMTVSLLTFLPTSNFAQRPQPQRQMMETNLPSVAFPAGKSFVEIPFEVEGNWMIIPVSVNDSRPLRFVFDTGASGSVLFNSSLADSLNLKFTGTRQVSGAGGGGATFEVKVAEDVKFNIAGIELSKSSLSQRPSNAGVDGVIGRALFAAAVVEINWENQIVKFYDPAKFKYSGSGVILPLTFDRGGRPYTMAAVSISGEKMIPVKLVLDTGGSHALFLELASKAGIKSSDGATKAVLGRGASGEITGFKGQVKEFQLGKYSVKDVPTGFLDPSSGTAGLNERDGNLGGGILRRFKVIYDYSREQMIVEPNKFINEPYTATRSTASINSTTVANLTNPPGVLQDYVGNYGERTITLEGGALYIQRPGGQKLKMVAATAKDEFTLETIPTAQIKFVRDEEATVTEIHVLTQNGSWDKSKKETGGDQPKSQNISKPSSKSVRTIQTAAADSIMIKELTAFLDQAASDDAFSGVVIVAKDGQPVFRKAYGAANKNSASPNTADTKFNLGSLNKIFTAVAVAQLAEKGRLSFDDKISKHLPDYPNKAVADKVTIHQLLTHTAGMGNYQNDKFYAQLDKIKSVSDLLPFFADESLAFEPGTKWQYSNSGYALLGLIIEKVSKQNYFDYVRENIFKPAGMTGTDSYEKNSKVPNLAIGYTRMNSSGQADPTGGRRENTAMRPFKGSPAGGGYSTAEDLLKFSIALKNNKLLSQKFTDILTAGKIEVGGPVGKYAYGFSDKIFNGRHIIGHNGGSPGIGANLDIFPELGYTAIVLTNYDPSAMMPVMMKIRGLIPVNQTSVSEQIKVQQTQQPLSQAEQEVRKLEREWLDAYENRDEERMNRILADDFTLTFSDNRVQTKADVLAQIKAAKKSGRPASKLSTEEVQSRAEGDRVFLSGIYIQRSDRGMMRMRYNDTYIKRNGRWQVASSQLSPIAEPQSRKVPNPLSDFAMTKKSIRM